MNTRSLALHADAPVVAGSAAHYDALDALRGVCALCVCLFHFKVNSPIADFAFIKGSWLFVDFFFVLSGFVIAANYRARLQGQMPIRDFALLRFGRIYPLHFVMLAAFVAMELVGLALAGHGLMQRPPFDNHHTVWAIVTNILLLQSFGLHDGLTWNHPSWSIATEFWTYLLFAVAARYAGIRLDGWLAVTAVACAAFLLLHGTDGINVTYDWGMVRCVYGFAVGALLCRWQPAPRAPAQPATPIATLVECATAAAVVAFVTLGRTAPIDVAAPLVFAAAVLVFARQGGAISALLTTAPFLRLGLFSYSIYMVHVFVQSRFDDVLKLIGRLSGVPLTTATHMGSVPATLVGADSAQGTALTVVMLVLVVATASLTWRIIERPGQAWARRQVRTG